MARTISPAAIESGTGRTWDDWLAYLSSIGAGALSHRDIVARVTDAGAPPWWGQMVTVAYEQHIGRRIPGQDGDGAFTVAASRTRPGSMDETLERWRSLVQGRQEFSGIGVSRAPTTSTTEKWRYWRCGLADGSRVVVMCSAKPPSKSVISVQHEQLGSADAVEHWRAYWKSLLVELG